MEATMNEIPAPAVAHPSLPLSLEAAVKDAKQGKPTRYEPKNYDKLPAAALKPRYLTRKAHRTMMKLERKQRRQQKQEIDNDSQKRTRTGLPKFIFDNNGGSLAASSIGDLSQSIQIIAGYGGSGDDNASGIFSAGSSRRQRQHFGLTPDLEAAASVGSREISTKNPNDPPTAVLPTGLQFGTPRIVNQSAYVASGSSVASNPLDGQHRGVDANTRFWEGDEEDQQDDSLLFVRMDRPMIRSPRLKTWLVGVTVFLLVATVTVALVANGKGESVPEMLTAAGLLRSNPPPATPPPPPAVENLDNAENDAAVSWTSAEIMTLLSALSVGLDDPDTPQGQAMDWLLQDSIDKKLTQTSLIQRFALATFYYSFRTEAWANEEGWVTPKHECFWYGILCDSVDLSVIYINLGNNNLRDSIPKELGLLSDLTQLHLESNSIIGSIPAQIFSKWSHLHTLFLNNNFIKGTLPETIKHLTSLEYCDIRTNSFGEYLPSVLGDLTHLVDLRLSNNIFEGSLPASLGNLEKLKVLLVGNNELDGKIPDSLANLSNLVAIHLHENLLSGTIPNLQSPHLEMLHLDNNKLTGPIPALVASAATLRELRVEQNLLTGEIPIELSDHGQLELLWLDNNKLAGDVPHELGKLSQLVDLRLHDNQLKGVVPLAVCDLRLHGVLASLTTYSNAGLTCTCCDEI